MRKLVGVSLIGAGIALAVYAGFWVCLVGGIVDVVDGVKETPVNKGLVAWGLVKALVLDSAAAAVSFWALAAPGLYLIGKRSKRRNKSSEQPEDAGK